MCAGRTLAAALAKFGRTVGKIGTYKIGAGLPTNERAKADAPHLRSLDRSGV